ncbi:MAG: tRNA1(Val) (adenine(37)-N6)-methyltransferase [Hyphomicrobiaceae bacterium]
MTPAGPDLTDDAFLGGRLNVLQPRSGFRAGIDAVFLAAAVPLGGDGDCRILDVGAGSGIGGLSVLVRAPVARLTGVDIDPDLVARAERNAERNGMSDRARFVAGDVRAGGPALEASGLEANTFDHVIANPPFFSTGTVRNSPHPSKDRANVMEEGDLEGWARFLAAAARSGGTVTVVHRADALAAVLDALAPRFGSVHVFPFFPREGQPASRILVQGRKGSRAPLTLLPGLVLHDADGGFTPPAAAVLREGAALPLETDCGQA